MKKKYKSIISFLIVFLICNFMVHAEYFSLRMNEDYRVYDEFIITAINGFSASILAFRDVAEKFCIFFLFLQMVWQSFQLMLISIDIRKVLIDLLLKMIIVSAVMTNYFKIVDSVLYYSHQWAMSGHGGYQEFLSNLGSNYQAALNKVISSSNYYGSIQGLLFLLVTKDPKEVNNIIKDQEFMKTLVSATGKTVEDIEAESPFMLEITNHENKRKLRSAASMSGGRFNADQALSVLEKNMGTMDTASDNFEKKYEAKTVSPFDEEKYLDDFHAAVSKSYKQIKKQYADASVDEIKQQIELLKAEFKDVENKNPSLNFTNAIKNLYIYSYILNENQQINVKTVEKANKESSVEIKLEGHLNEGQLRDKFNSYYFFNPFITVFTNKKYGDEIKNKKANFNSLFSSSETNSFGTGIISPSAFINANFFYLKIMFERLCLTVKDNGEIAEDSFSFLGISTRTKTVIDKFVGPTVRTIFRFIIGILVLIMLCVVTLLGLIQYCTTLIEYVIITSIAIILVPALFFDITKQYGQNLLKMFISYFFKLLVTLMVTFQCMGFMVRFLSNVADQQDFCNLKTIMYIFFVGALMRALIAAIPQIASVLTSGEPKFGLGDVAHAVHSMMHAQQMVGNQLNRNVIQPAKKAAGFMGKSAANAGVKGFYGAMEYKNFMNQHKGEAPKADLRKQARESAQARLKEINMEMNAYKGTSAFNAAQRINQRHASDSNGKGNNKEGGLTDSIKNNAEKMQKLNNV